MGLSIMKKKKKIIIKTQVYSMLSIPVAVFLSHVSKYRNSVTVISLYGSLLSYFSYKVTQPLSSCLKHHIHRFPATHRLGHALRFCPIGDLGVCPQVRKGCPTNMSAYLLPPSPPP